MARALLPAASGLIGTLGFVHRRHAHTYPAQMKLFHLITTTQSLGFLRGQAAFMRSEGLDVHIVSSPGPELAAFGEREAVRTHAVRMVRRISPLQDIVSICNLFALFRRERPDIVHVHTPKASLVGVIAAWAARVPHRIFHSHGLPHSTASGFGRALLLWSTKLPSVLATRVLCVSPSVAAQMAEEKLCPVEKLAVLHYGSSNGVEAKKAFCPVPHAKGESRAALGFAPGDLIIGFAGRLVRDKGLSELYRAWTAIREEFPNTYLLIAGCPENRDALPPEVLRGLQSDSRVRMLGQFANMPQFYAALDLFALPSYREGLPSVVLESAAMGIPSVTTRAVGAIDSVVDGATGLLVDVGNSLQLEKALRRYLKDPQLRDRHGKQARERVLHLFCPEDVWRAILSEYQSLVSESRAGLRQQFMKRAAKRTLDICVSSISLAIAAPLLAMIALFVRLRMGRPVLFRQIRPGLNERPFQMLKFRTMRDAYCHNGEPLPDRERLTRLGEFLRRTSLDELPELWNVLKGDMSLVGPRPLLLEYLPRYNDLQRRRHDMKPGITGWAQVNGRNALTWQEKFDLDLWYIENFSLSLDLKILWMTFSTVLRSHGVAQQGHVTMPKFAGNVPEPDAHEPA